MNQAIETLGITPEQLVKEMKERGFKFKRGTLGGSSCGCAITALLERKGLSSLINEKESFKKVQSALNLTATQCVHIIFGFDLVYSTVREDSIFASYGRMISLEAEKEGILVDGN